MKFPFYHQLDSMDCGPTCLQMIAKFYNKNISLQLLKEKSQIGKEGVNMLGLCEAAEYIGFKTQPVRISYTSLVNDATLPCILHWNQYHFVISLTFFISSSLQRMHLQPPFYKVFIRTEKPSSGFFSY
jgi:ATP-binding cassette, subfamily B, bacterial